MRLPGAETLDELWDNLAAGRCLISEMPPARMDAAAVRAMPGQEATSLWGGFVADADRFDSGFFNLSPREVAWMDPQQRWALELAWTAIEDAAIRPSALAGSRTGVFMGVCHWDYAELIEKHVTRLDANTPTGIAFSIIANRVSHFLDLRGPSVVNDTACAASLVALHDAVRALQNGTCTLALAGGVNLIWSPNHFVTFSKNGMLSKQGRSRAFDDDADGYVRGEGGAMLLLKPLQAALADGDPIHAVIRGIGTNHGGRTNSLTVTNPRAQAELIAEVWRQAGVGAETVGYIEAHGPGTPLGDPIEIAGLKQAMQILRAQGHAVPASGSCGVGSVKSNIGHLEGAAGVAGIAKVLAALRHGALPRNAGFKTLNRLIDLDDSPFRIQSELTPWPTGDVPRRAGVSSFGFGGSNAHALLEEAPAAARSVPPDGPVVVPLSGRTEAHLRANVQALRAFLATHAPHLPDLARTLHEGRETFTHRAAFTATTVDELTAVLDQFLLSGVRQAVADTDTPSGQRIHAPTSSFLRERHWFDTTLGAKDKLPVPHPMLHRNVSRLGRHAYRSVFDGAESFWAGHEVQGRQIMPGAACLEMARAAYRAATGKDGAIRLDGVVWLRPIIRGAGAVTVDITIEPHADGQLAFSIRDGERPNVQGMIFPALPPAVPPLDLAALHEAADTVVAPEDCYARLRSSGVVHGPAFQALASVRRGEDAVFAELRLSRLLQPTLSELTLHPILLDAAIQAWVGLDDTPPSAAHVPFACDTIALHAPCTAIMSAHVRRSPSGQAPGLVRLDIDLADREGRICAALRGLVLRAVNQSSTAVASPVLLARGAWENCPLQPTADVTDTTLLLCGFASGMAGQVATRTGLSVLTPPATEGIASQAMCWVAFLQAQLSDMLATRSREKRQVLALVQADAAPAAAALSAMLRTVAVENSMLFGAAIVIGGPADAERLARIAHAEAERRDHFTALHYNAHDQRAVWRARPVRPDAPALPSLDPDCVYWITGGAGALGLIFAQALAERGARHIVLSGRARAASLPILPGVSLAYVACDVTDSATVEAVVAGIGKLRGIIHAAGVLDDGFLFGSDPSRVAPVLAPKILGTTNIDRATAALELDFFVLFSSMAAIVGNPGQAVYAAANGFLDGFAEQRAAQVARGERHGTTLSIAWPLWDSGGMGQSPDIRISLRHQFGIVPLPTEAGITAFWQALAGGPGRAVVLHGDLPRLAALLDDAATPTATAPTVPQVAVSADPGLAPRVVGYLKDLLGESVAMEPSRIWADTPLVEYGLNSIAIVELTARLEQVLGPLSKTLFFEYIDLASLAAHLTETHRDALTQLLPGDAPLPATVPAAPISNPAPRQFAPATDTHDIAIVGLSLRVAGANDKDAFWAMLDAGRHAFGPVPQSRWDHAALVHPERDVLGKTVVRTGAFLDDVAGFDPRYFRISQREAELMSPEVRLFLQASVEAFEDAGYSRETLQRLGGDVAVIVGSMTNEYDLYGFENMLQRGSLASGSYTGTVPNMVSYFYGFTGPSYFLDTMCSASSTCIHEAVHMLRAGRCRMALAGGVSLLLHPQKLIAASQEHFTSKTADVIRGYGLGADGTILGEGVGAVVLKTLADAERDGDHIYAVIKGTGVSNAGMRNGFTVPNPAQQDAAITQALDDAGIDPATISYIEGHGSGTSLGDPIEIRALTSAWRRHTDAQQICPIGTVKSNVGHLLAAAGVTGVAKVLMQMQHGRLAASLHAETLNPAIPFADTPFFVQREAAVWQRPEIDGHVQSRRAAVTSIGAGGMNSHIVLEEYAAAASPVIDGEQVIVLSAMTPARLVAWAERLSHHLRATDLKLADLAWTLQVGRNALPCRLAFVAGTVRRIAETLAVFAADPRARDGLFYTPNVLDIETPQASGDTPDQVAAAWTRGATIDWDSLHPQRPHRVSLPTYPFDSVRCWYPLHDDAPSVIRPLGARQKLHPLIGRNVSNLSGLRFRTDIHLDELLDYVAAVDRKRTLVPTVAIEMIGAAAHLAGLRDAFTLRDLRVHPTNYDTIGCLEFLVMPYDGGARITVTADAQLCVEAIAGTEPTLLPHIADTPHGTVLEHDAIYATLARHGFDFYPYLLVLERASITPGGTVCATLRDQPSQQDHFKRNEQFPARLLAAAYQALQLASDRKLEPLAGAETITWTTGTATQVVVRGPDVMFLDASGRTLAAWHGIRFGFGCPNPTLVEAPPAGLQERLIALAAALLKFPADTLNPRAHFHDLGFDSVSLTQFASTIDEEFGVAISPALFFQVEHIAALTAHLSKLTPADSAVPRPQDVAASTRPRQDEVARGTSPHDGLAIIGLALRVPGADTPDAFIDRLLAGDDLVTPLPLDRFNPADATRLRTGVPCWAGSLADIDRFDAALFRVSPAEAERMDPRQRLILEATWRTLEDAGLYPEQTPRPTGVFIGASGHDWASLLASHGVAHDGFVATGTSAAMIANRVSHSFDWHGPSETIDTACSSSLVALCRAADALRSGACELALVGGVNLNLVAEGFEGPQSAGMLSPGGRCRSFGAGADGYVRGEGVICLLLKPLAAARRDGDRIHGVLLGGAVNHGGRAGAVTAPNARAQADLIENALNGIDPASISYIEAHGTGTALGDPVEVAGLQLAFHDAAARSIGLGSVKSAIGHLEAAAGLAGVAKMLLAMQRGELPPTLHCAEINPHIALDGTPLHLVRERTPWRRPHRAGISSFGFGGANAHVVIEGPPLDAQPGRPALPPRPFANTRFWVSQATPDTALLFAPDWVEAPLPVAAEHAPRRVLVDFGLGLIGAVPIPQAADPATFYAMAAETLLRVVQDTVRDTQPVLLQLAVPLGDDRALLEGLGALLDTAAIEAPHLRGQVVGIAPEHAADAATLLAREAANPSDKRVRHVAGRRLVRHWQEIPDSEPYCWRAGGVFLITGGMGGLGRLIAQDIAARASCATLILAGSRAPAPWHDTILDGLRAQGATARYCQLDVTDAAAVASCVQEILARHGALHGVLHAAGVLRDSALARKTPQDMTAVLAPKIAGAFALDAACRDLTLDQFVLFSSLASVAGNAGQADYAAANGFLDALAERRHGAMVSISWPLWRDGGMRMDAASEAGLYARMGQRPLNTEAGLAALRAACASGRSHLAVAAGEAASIRRFFADIPINVPLSAQADSGLEDKVTQALRQAFAQASGLPGASIAAGTPLEEYGIDSLMVVRLNQALGDRFRVLDHTLLFRHRTLRALARHLVARHPDDCAHWVGGATPAQVAPTPLATPAVVAAGTDPPIAVIGLSGRYPGAPDLDTFWQNLCAGRDMVGEIPSDRWALDGFFDPDPAEAVRRGMSYAKWGGFLDGFADFDPGFFRIAARDAAAMDPQERLFLMLAWAACEDAGYPPSRLTARHGGRVGVFAGITKTGFALHGGFAGADGSTIRPTTSFASAANRVSYALDLTGPSQPVDTMCSSSLTAIHAACEALRAGTCELALAGGVNLYLHPSNYVELSAARMLSPQGRCRSFGAGADGFVPGEGVGCVLLKPLDRALADGDQVHAVIRATAVNHGGHTSGYTVPNPGAQAALVRDALHKARLAPGDVTCIEAHGTGTDLGDPIEVAGLTQAFAGAPDGHCALGSVKSAIGHLEAAAGIAGVTKVILQMRHRTLAPTLHADPINPRLDLAASPFALVTAARPWIAPRLIAGVSSFGAGGANAHVILEAPPVAADRPNDVTAQLVPLSARDHERLREAAAQLLHAIDHEPRAPTAADGLSEVCARVAGWLGVDPTQIDPTESLDAMGFEPMHRLALRDWLAERLSTPPPAEDLATPRAIADLLTPSMPTLRLADIAWTLQIGREPMDARLAIAAASLDELAQALRGFIADQDAPGLHVGAPGARQALAAALDGDDEAMRTLTERWLQRGDLGRLARLWVQGVDIDWTTLPRGTAPCIVSLPTYPFRRDRFWLGTNLAKADSVRQAIERVAEPVPPSGKLEQALAPLLRAILATTPTDAIIPRYARWRQALDALLPIEPAPTLESAWRQWDNAGSGSSAQGALAEVALRALPDILSGAVQATSVLFPSGSLRLVEAVYAEDPIAARFNGSLAAAAAAFIADHPGLRVLEIGSGTGSTTDAVLRALDGSRDLVAEYRSTDVSRAFLIQAERRFADWPALRTALFDVERPLDGQDVAPGSYDLVIAANVLHATTDIARTLTQVRATLADGGLLLLNETNRATLFTHLTFGLLDGWWRAADTQRRIPGTPSLTAASWRTALEENGFAFLCVSPEAEQALGQQVIAARAAKMHTAPHAEPLIETLRRLVAETLNVAPVAVALDAPFADYGLDSILGATLVERVRATLGIPLEHRQLFESRNVAQLAAHLSPSLPALSAPSVVPAARTRPAQREPIAIVGYSGRFAQAPDVDAFWAHLIVGHDLVGPSTRPGLEGRVGSFLDTIDQFDAAYFGISGHEARYMDPQQRLFLEQAWTTLEHAGHAGDIAGRRCGVFVGASAGDYDKLFRTQPPGQAFWGNTSSLIPARIAYFLDLKGPAVAIDTACSSALVALHLACQSLARDECELALAGGVFVQCTDRFFRSAEPAGMLSPIGRCAAFGEAADGIVPGEAVGAVLLRKLSAALADGDTIHGLVIATGSNQDGATNGITAPSAESQERLMREVYATHGIDPASISLIEAHGTGTPLGDPIEAAALTRVFAGRTTPARLGSVKANIGHATTAAGMAGLMKLLLTLRHRMVPLSIHVGGGNPAVQFAGTLRINQTPEPWDAPAPRRAAISSFGFGGTNAHAVIEEAPTPAALSDAPSLVLLSARTEVQLRAQVEALLAHLAATPGLMCADVAFTLAVGRRHLPHRLALRADTIASLQAGLRSWLDGDRLPDVPEAAGFLSGTGPDIGTIAPPGRRRVPLPTTQFLPTRHWVDDGAVEQAPVIPGKVRLADAMAPAPLRTPATKVILAPIVRAPITLREDADRDGVRTLVLRGACSDALIRECDAIRPDVRALLLRVEPDATGLTLAMPALKDVPVPVVCAGSAGMLAAACDFVAEPEQARAMARQIAEASREALSVLIRHKRAQSPIALDRVAEATLTGLMAGKASAGGATRRVTLESNVVRLELYDDGVALLRMQDLAHRNMFTDALMDGLEAAFAAIARSEAVKVVVLTGASGCFACGGTREGLRSLQQGATRFTDRQIYSLPLTCPVPVIAAMDGHAIGAGWSLGMFCDVRLFGEESLYHSNYLRLGFTPGAGATLVFPVRFGAMGWELLFTATDLRGRALAARSDDVAAWPNAEVLDVALMRAHGLARSSRTELMELKSALARPLRERLDAILAAELAMHRTTLIGNADALRQIEALADDSAPSPRQPELRRETKAAEADPAADMISIRIGLAASLAEELMINAEDVTDDAAFIDLGMDSILAVTWMRRLNARLGTALPATTVYAHPTLRALVEHIASLPPAPPTAPEPVVPEPPPLPATARAADPASSIPEPIAIIGASGRFPKAPDLDTFWANIRAARDCVDEVPPDRWDIAQFYDPDSQAPGKSSSKWMGAIDNVDQFDPGFFNITPREAELMDPQQRLFLQHAWHAIEDAAIDPMRLAGTACGVFVGSGPSGYADLVRDRNAYSLVGNAGSILAARIAYLLDLAGPAISLDTACSSSLVAIAQACNALLLRDCDLALAGGTSVLIGASMFVDTSKVGMLSPQGRCFTFDARANGFVPGEGIGVMVLKRLADAVRDGDPVRAVIRGWGTNQDGRTNGITAPNPEAQTRLIRGIHARFGIDPDSIDLIECHGTGTALGDPIEIEGLAAAFDGVAGPIALGSVKSNVGHLLASAGVAGAMKAMLALQARELPPTALFEQVNPHLALAGTPFRIGTELRPWVRRDAPRRVGVSSFGFSGTNAHLVLEEAPRQASPVQRGSLTLPLAARTPDRLRVYAQRLVGFVEARPELDLAGLAASFHRRTQFDCRSLVEFDDRATLLAGLRSIAGGFARIDDKIDWPTVPIDAGRLHAPGYPFATQRCWVTPGAQPVRPVLQVAYTDLAGGLRAKLTPDGSSDWFRNEIELALALPLLARTAVVRAAGWQAVALSELVWGQVTTDGASRVADITLTADGANFLFDIVLDGGPICHLGTASSGAPIVPAVPRLDGAAIRVEALERGDGIEPALLNALARELRARAGADQVPYAAARMWFAAALTPGLTLRIVTNADASFTVIGTDATDTPVLLLETLMMRPRHDLPDLLLEPVQEAAE